MLLCKSLRSLLGEDRPKKTQAGAAAVLADKHEKPHYHYPILQCSKSKKPCAAPHCSQIIELPTALILRLADLQPLTSRQ